MERFPRTLNPGDQPQGRIATLGNVLKTLKSRSYPTERPSDATCLAATAGAASSATTKEPSNPFDERLVLYKSYARSLSPGHDNVYEATVRGWLYQPGGNRKGKIMMAAVERLVGASGARTDTEDAAHHDDASDDPLVDLNDFSTSNDNWSMRSRNRRSRSRTRSSRNSSRSTSRDFSDSSEDMPGYSEELQPISPIPSSAASSRYSPPPEENKSSVRDRLAAVSHRSLALKDVHVTVFPQQGGDSRTFLGRTDDGGRFSLNCKVPFMPGEVKVTAGNVQAETNTIFVPPSGISVISDIDDTVRLTGVTKSKREVLQNVLLKNFDQVKLEGVAEWYNQLASQGAKFHYVSNSPWQLYDSIHGFLQHHHFPEGSIHLKRYQGIFDGILEPAQGRKRAVLDSILRDFPSRKFILVGDSGEADLEAYAELARKYPEQILAIYIRDITLPPEEPQLQYEQLRRAKTEPNQRDLIDMHSSEKLNSTQPVVRPPVPPRPAHLKPKPKIVPLSEAEPTPKLKPKPKPEPQVESEPKPAETEREAPPLPQRPPLPRRSSSRARLASAVNSGGVAGAVFGAVASASSAAHQAASRVLAPPVPPRPTPSRGSSPRSHPPPPRQSITEPPGFLYSSQEPEVEPDRIDKRVESWKMRFAHHSRNLPAHVRLRTWRNPNDVKEESLRLAKDPKKPSSLI